MALHRDIFWVGRQWAVTGFGIQACDQKQKGQFDIEASRLWEDSALESVRALKWLNSDDFEKAVSVARKHYPEAPRTNPPPEEPVSPAIDVVAPESPRPASRKLGGEVRARFLPVWRIRFRFADR
jgi:hypothetical protein